MEWKLKSSKQRLTAASQVCGLRKLILDFLIAIAFKTPFFNLKSSDFEAIFAKIAEKTINR